MKCKVCKNELKEDALFCNKCGEKVTNKNEKNMEIEYADNIKINKEVSNSKAKEDKAKISPVKRVFLVILVVIILIILISFGIYLNFSNISINNENKKGIDNVNENNTSTEEIPENEKVNVLFQDEQGNTSLEERKVSDRERLLEYPLLMENKVAQDLALKGLATYQKKGVIYYIEYDVQIEGLEKIKRSDCGSIIFFSCIKFQRYGASYYRVIGTIWNSITNANNNYVLEYDTGDMKNQPNLNNIQLASTMSVLKKTYGLNKNIYSNIRIGTISRTHNSWISEACEVNEENEEQNNSKTIKEAYEELIKQSNQYTLVDINNDGTKELVLVTGTCNADAKFTFYTYKDGKAVKLGENGYCYSGLYKMNDGNYLKQVYGHGGYQMVYNINYDGNTFEVKEIESRQLTYAEELNNGYEKGDNEITMFENTDLNELNKLDAK